ncbi:uncharacterized protein [Lolium perenne]|uniref:uncharacterized protein n=1 Tax=Lolium perenne TaxID=4522 RepID=UPI0021F55571|nr:uncharacterized protein LOC127311199 [Lolium perenne]
MAITSSPMLSLLLLALLCHSSPSAAQNHSAVINISAVEAAVRDRAFELLRRTNQLVAVAPLPDHVSAGAQVEASALRVRSNSLWADGVNETGATAGFTVPPRVVPAPFARRVDVVFLRFLLPDGAALFAAPQGYALAAPVVALLAYDVSSGPNGSEVALRALGAPVRVEFGNLSLSSSVNATEAPRCVTFAAASGKAVATHAMASPTECAVTGTGHYGVAVRLEVPSHPTPTPAAVRQRWWAWTVVAGAGGVVALSFLAVTVAGAVRWSRRRRREEMELRALAGEELGRMAVRGSKMPSAKMVRTRPEMEEGSPLPWRR